MRNVLKGLLFCSLLFYCLSSYADIPSITAMTVTPGANGSQTYSLSLKIVALMTLLMVLPALLMTMTSFTRIIIVLAILRQAIGLPNVPTNQILIGLALFLSLFIMAPVLQKTNDTALQPYLQHKLNEADAFSKGIKPFREFMLKQTRKEDLALFMKLSHTTPSADKKEVSMLVLMPSFLTSELKTAFQMGFLLFLPFLIIDLVVASVLMSMGMMMLSPPIVSAPFKIMLFVMINGWVLILGTLATSFGLS